MKRIVKKIKYLFFIALSFLFFACPDPDNENNILYNYNGKSVGLSVNVENKTDEEIDFSLSSYLYSSQWKKFQEVSADASVEGKLAANEKKQITFRVMDNNVLHFAKVIKSPAAFYYQTLFGSIKYADSTEKKIIGYDLDKVQVPDFKKEDFSLTGFGYYLVDTSIESDDGYFGKYVAENSISNGKKDGLIKLNILVTETEIQYSYSE